ncbi:MAG: hypothetical protein H0X12_15485 [Nocardioides sp.]|nr:hypothetical protein [Nocardioides sp.]
MQDIGTGDRRRLDLPTELRFGLATWESPQAVILQTRLPFDGFDDRDAGVQALVRCDAGTGACERVSGAPTGVPVLPS